jgi:MacB-like periplasmic core domain
MNQNRGVIHRSSFRIHRCGGNMESLLKDIRYGIRTLLKNRGFTAVAVLALALGIGANTALFSVVNGVLLRPLAFNEPERLGQLYEENREHSYFLNSVSAPNFLDWKNQSQLFGSMAAYANAAVNVTGLDEPERVAIAVVTADFFQTLKVEPLLGRAFQPEDIKPGGPNLVVLSYGFWQRRFGGDATAVNQSLTVEGRNYTIIGVMPREAQLPSAAVLGAVPNRLQHGGPSQSELSSDRTPQAGRKLGASAGRDGRHRRAPRASLSAGGRGLDSEGRAGHGCGGRRDSTGARGAARRGRLRAVDCVRERGESTARACGLA